MSTEVAQAAPEAAPAANPISQSTTDFAAALSRGVSDFKAAEGAKSSPQKASNETAPQQQQDNAPAGGKPKAVKVDPKNPFAALDDVKIVEEQKAEEKPQDEQPAEPDPSDKGAGKRWKELKEKELRLAEVEAKAAEYEAKLKDLESKPFIDEATKAKIAELEKLQFANDLQSTQEWRDNIVTPISEANQTLTEIAEFAGINPKRIEEIVYDTSLNRFQRKAALSELLGESAKEFDRGPVESDMYEAASVIAAKIAEGRQLHEKSAQLREAMEAEKTTKTLAQKQAEQEQWTKASKDVFEKVSSHPVLKDLMSDPELREAVSGAVIGEDPTTRAYQAQAAYLLPSVAKELSLARSEVAKLTKALEARSAAKPGSVGSPAPVNTPPPAMSFEDRLAGALSATRR